MQFSSRPGDLISKDDFFAMSSNLVVMETSLLDFNSTLFSTQSSSSLPCWIRVNIANRVATNATSWIYYFGRYLSGTHNAQWTVVDYNRLQANLTQDNLVFVVEAFFDMYKFTDVTQEYIHQQGFFASYNVPFNNEIQQVANYTVNYTTDPRYYLFQQYGNDATSLANLQTVLRSNANKTGDPCNALAPRCDLSASGAQPFGAIDYKTIDQSFAAEILSSPTTDGEPPFSFTGQWKNYSHMGMPTLYNFSKITMPTIKNLQFVKNVTTEFQ